MFLFESWEHPSVCFIFLFGYLFVIFFIYHYFEEWLLIALIFNTVSCFSTFTTAHKPFIHFFLLTCHHVSFLLLLKQLINPWQILMCQYKIIFSYDWFIQLLFPSIASFFLDVCGWTWWLMVFNTTDLFGYYAEVCLLVLSTVIFWTIFLFLLVLWTIFSFFLDFDVLWVLIGTIFIFG